MAKHSDVPTTGLLSGVKVVACTAVIAAPFAVAMWAENGADVIWIEDPRKPDQIRNPTSLIEPQDRRNHRALSMDIFTPEGREVLFRLLKDTDIFIENLRGGSFEKQGLSDDVLWKANPALVIVHVSGYGQTGLPEYITKAGLDAVGQAFSGYMYMLGNPDPEPPLKMTPNTGDYITALTACWSGLAALVRARATGEGESVDVSLYESILRMSTDAPTKWLTWGQQTERMGVIDPVLGGYHAWCCKDGKWIFIAPTTTMPAVKAAVELLGFEWGSEDFPGKMPVVLTSTPGGQKFEAAWKEYTSKRTLDEVVAELDRLNIPYSPVNTFKQVAENPQVIARGDFMEWDDPRRGHIKGISPLPKLKKHPQPLWRTAPAVGEDNEDILAEAGYSSEEIQSLYERKVIAHP